MKSLLELFKDNKIVCPLSNHWIEFYEILKECNQYNRYIPPPLICDASCRNMDLYKMDVEQKIKTELMLNKQERFFDQVKFAWKNPMYFRTNKFLRRLNIDEDFEYSYHYIVRSELYDLYDL